VRRTSLHRALVDRAAAVGVDLRWGCACRSLLEDGFDTDDGPVCGRWLVAADGRASAIRRQAGLDGRRARRRRFGVRRHYRIAPWTDLVEVHWVDGVEAYVTPVASELVGVALLWRDGVTDFDRLLTQFPVLVERFTGAEVASSDRGAGPLEQRARKVTRGRLALVGDASGYLDAISGEGLSLAFHQAEALVEAMVAGDLRSYAMAHRRIGRHPLRLTSLLLLLSDHPRLRRRVMGRLAADPSLMSRFLSLKGRPGGSRVFGREGLVHLALATVAGGRST
jgi:flavin-dependent dehydrogenase